MPDDIDIRLTRDVLNDARAALMDQGTDEHNRAAQAANEQDAAELRAQGDRHCSGAKMIAEKMHDSQPLSWRINGGMSDQRGSSGNSSIMQIDNSKLVPWMVLTGVLSGVAVAVSIVLVLHIGTFERQVQADNDFTRRHVEELRIRVVDTDVLIQVAGIKKPGDAISGPANPQRLNQK